MRKSFFISGITILLIFVISSNSFGDNQWINVGLEGGLVNALAINPQTPDTLYAGTFGGGVFESTDGGKNWSNPRIIAEADLRKGEERWITPRITLLKSGRLIVICDHDDYRHTHEDQPSGIWIWFSDDQGRTWSRPRLTGLPGIEPGRIIELADGTLLMSSHMAFRDTFKLGEFVMRSRDGGLTWADLSVISKDRVIRPGKPAIP